MTYYLVDAVLLIALLVTTVRVTQMHRDLKKLRHDQAQFCSILGEAASAFDVIVRTVNDLNSNGTHLIRMLGVKIDEARQLVAAVDGQVARTGRTGGGAGGSGSADQPVAPHGAAGKA